MGERVLLREKYNKSTAVKNGVDASMSRIVFSRAFAKKAQPLEEGESRLKGEG